MQSQTGKSFYLFEPRFLIFKMALMLYKTVVKITDNVYEPPHSARQKSKCSIHVAVIVITTIIFMILLSLILNL